MQVNRYFNDHVLSIGFDNSNGRSTVGVMLPGFYKFLTDYNERVVVISGALLVEREADIEPILFSDGEEFQVPREQTFSIEVTEPTAYLREHD